MMLQYNLSQSTTRNKSFAHSNQKPYLNLTDLTLHQFLFRRLSYPINHPSLFVSHPNHTYPYPSPSILAPLVNSIPPFPVGTYHLIQFTPVRTTSHIIQHSHPNNLPKSIPPQPLDRFTQFHQLPIHPNRVLRQSQ